MERVIKTEELDRVEGHGKIEVVLDNEEIKDVKMAIFEGPRFFEAFVEVETDHLKLSEERLK